MNAPEIIALEPLDWQFFGTLTFKSAKLPEAVRISMWFAFSREMARWFRVHFKKVLWVLRKEVGEAGGRYHFHFLIGGLPNYALDRRWAARMESMWESLGGGMARIRVYDSRQSGGSYLTKCLSGEDAYETGKFQISDLILSDSIKEARLAHLHRQKRRGTVAARLVEGPSRQADPIAL